MKAKRNLLPYLLTAGVSLAVGGVLVINNIESIAGEYRWTIQILLGLMLGAFPFIIGTLIALAAIIKVLYNVFHKAGNTR